jgi:hypothetical protein
MTRTWVCAVGLGLVVGLAALPASRAADPPTKAELDASLNNLKRIAIGFHAFHDVNGALPNNVYSKDGKPLLSWRVQILPYVEQVDLYKQFKLDEPWDSETNKKLIEKMPKLYAPVRVKAKPGETFYQVFTGEKAIFGPNKKTALFSIPDGTANTGMVFEAGEPVVWTKPADLPFDEGKPLPKLGGLFDGDFHVAMADGSVIFCKKDADEKELKKLIMPADGFVIDFKKIKK